MNIAPIYLKEWLKLRWFALALWAVALVSSAYFAADLVNQFANIEPESMMWYRFVHLRDKPYAWITYFFLANGFLVAVCQYVPEVLKRTVRILTHLPIPLNQVIRQHLIAGFALLIVLNGTLSLAVMATMKQYYPTHILWEVVKDLAFAQLPALVMYMGLSSVIIESQRRYQALKLLLTFSAVFAITKELYHTKDLWALLLVAWLALPVKDSFLSVKTRRLNYFAYRLIIAPIVIALCLVTGWQLEQRYHTPHQKYYVFYSDVLNDFVYQENGANHTFHYGTQDSAISKAEFESALPFVYWKNLDIQGKLPITIGDVTFDKRTIRAARMSLQYSADKLHSSEVKLYPLFNPISSKGSIRFPEMAVAFENDRLAILAAETAREDEALSFVANQLAAYYSVAFPVRNVWGKTTNMKPFDWGYFVQDANGRLFNFGRADNKLYLKPVKTPEDVGDIEYVQVAENRHKKFYGYAINSRSKVYLISYPNYQFIPLDLEGFNHKTMSFQLLADPVNYVVRFNDGVHYNAVRFSKNYEKLDSVVFE
ncbi:DUF4857 domain-containing protein [Vibrio sonorensis]|uniref:DUF4857 domain-containing protein n=1 Tax=Vibrio sonorensis TaxID=1004316 RepID=UPI0008D9F0EF|nr:DUF4857 domain-containing protein [Vibrio sonorensis]